MRRLNRYTCGTCGGSIITVDADDGTTPFTLACRARSGCCGTMLSSCYRGVSGEASFVWRKPTRAEYAASGPAMRRHFDLGGLAIHPIPPSDGAEP